MNLIPGKDYYHEDDYIVFTKNYLQKNGKCCGNGCRHCPYDELKVSQASLCIQDTLSELSLINVKFTENDIKDIERLNKMIDRESKVIYESASARRDRDYDTVKFCVKQGKVAELYLIENFGYEESDKKYHDLKDSDGNYTEVKAYSIYSANAPSVHRDLKRIRTEGWNVSKWYILFSYNYGVYSFLDKIQIR